MDVAFVRLRVRPIGGTRLACARGVLFWKVVDLDPRCVTLSPLNYCRVVAHELAHHKLGHIWKAIGRALLQRPLTDSEREEMENEADRAASGT